MHTERRKALPSTSLQTIPYVGDVFARKFGARGIRDTTRLLRHIRRSGASASDSLLRDVFTKANGSLDVRALNSTLLFAHDRGLVDLPPCQRL